MPVIFGVPMLLPLIFARTAAIVSITQAGVPAQIGQRKTEGTDLTVERMLSGEFNEDRPDVAGEWRPDAKHVLVQRPARRGPAGVDLVLVDPATGKSSVVVAANRLIPKGDRYPLSVESYELSDDAKHLLIFTNSKRVWRRNTRGDYWALDNLSGKLLKLGGDAEPSSLMFAKLSPDGSRAAYVYKNNLYVEDLTSEKITPLTTDGSDQLIDGTSDWVYEEELDVRDGWRWSPDGKSIAYWQIDSSAEPIYSLINDTDELYPKVRQFPYPKTGQTNPTVRIGVVASAGGPTTWMKDVATSENGYIARLEWAPDSSNLLLEHLNRLQNENRYLVANAESGEVRQVFADTDSAWVDVMDTGENGVRWCDAGRGFLALSERDGWRHLYAVPFEGGPPKLLTPAPFDVDEVSGIDEDDGLVYFTASPEDSKQRYLFSASFKSPGPAQRVTPNESVGTNRYEISPDGKLAFHFVSRYAEPDRSELIRLPDHSLVKPLGDNAALKARLAKLRLGSITFMQLEAANGAKMDSFLLLPPDFDPKKRYPVLFNVYGEPAGVTVEDTWDGGHLFDQLIAERGYIVASIDNRGTPALKGRAWRKSVYRKIGVIASEDQAAGLKQLEKLPYIDSARIGIWGWSGGGTMTLNMLFRYPDLYHLGMSVAPVPDMHLYDTIYQERYMGLPQANDADYVAGSPITYANQLKGDLLIVHGSGDDNVHYQGTERLVNRLVTLDKPFQLMVYPNRTHAISEGAGTSRHLYELLLRFLTTNMPP